MRQLMVAVVSATFMLLVAVASASAHFDTSGQYTHGTSGGCTTANRIDPINVVFYTWGTWGRAEDQVTDHAVWWYGDGSQQTFYDHGNCSLMHTQRASLDQFNPRYHIRIRGQHSDPTLGWTATGDAHHEDLVVTCGHAVDANGPNGSGFDQGRAQLSNAMSLGGHSYYYSWWGNTQNFKQCDGDYAGSDGATSFIQLHQVNH
jgi:hypothetical protein